MATKMKEVKEVIHNMMTEAKEKATPDMRVIKSMKINELIRQGDIYLRKIDGSKFRRASRESTSNRQLAPGNSPGSRHCIKEDSKHVKIWKREAAYDKVLKGPVVEAKDRFTLVHPEHAHFSLPAGTYECWHQRDFVEDELEVRRVRD